MAPPPFHPQKAQILKQNFKGCFPGIAEDERVGPLRNLLQERFLWLLSHRVGFPGLTAASAAFFFLSTSGGQQGRGKREAQC